MSDLILLAENALDQELAREAAKLAIFISSIGALSWIVEAVLRRFGK